MDIDEFLEAEVGKGNGGSLQKSAAAEAGEFLSNQSIEEQIRQIRELVRQRKFGEAEQIYLLVKSHYATLERKQSDERKTLHRSLTEVNRELIESLTQMKAEVEKKGSVINQLIVKAKELIVQGDMYKANKIYLEIKEMFKAMPEAFTERKAELENEIVVFYSHLVREFNKQTYSKIVERGRQIELHILTALEYLNQGNLDAAKKEYEVIYQFYTALPEGFIYEKTMIYNQILALHKLAETGVKSDDAKQELFAMKAALSASTTLKQVNKRSVDNAVQYVNSSIPSLVTPSLFAGKEQFNPVEKKQVSLNAVKTSLKPAVMQEKKSFFSFLKKQKRGVASVETIPNIEERIRVKPDAAITKLDSPPLPSV